MMFTIYTTHYRALPERVASGQPWSEIIFEPSLETVEAINDEDAIRFAKRLGFANPILKRINGNATEERPQFSASPAYNHRAK